LHSKKKQISVYFEMPCNINLRYFSHPFGVFPAICFIFPFWCDVPGKIWQPCFRLPFALNASSDHGEWKTIRPQQNKTKQENNAKRGYFSSSLSSSFSELPHYLVIAEVSDVCR
jgi:hypothetical protein